MAKDKSQNIKYEGYQEYPKYVGEGESRRLVNNEVEEEEHAKQFGGLAKADESSKPEDKPKPAGWDTAKK